MLTDLTVVDIYETGLEDTKEYLEIPYRLYTTEQARYNILIPFRVTISEFIEEINRDHSDAWIDYDEEDWIVGMYEWTSWRLMEDNIYNLINIIQDTPYGKIGRDYKRLMERYGGV